MVTSSEIAHQNIYSRIKHSHQGTKKLIKQNIQKPEANYKAIKNILFVNYFPLFHTFNKTATIKWRVIKLCKSNQTVLKEK